MKELYIFIKIFLIINLNNKTNSLQYKFSNLYDENGGGGSVDGSYNHIIKKCSKQQIQPLTYFNDDDLLYQDDAVDDEQQLNKRSLKQQDINNINNINGNNNNNFAFDYHDDIIDIGQDDPNINTNENNEQETIDNMKSVKKELTDYDYHNDNDNMKKYVKKRDLYSNVNVNNNNDNLIKLSDVNLMTDDEIAMALSKLTANELQQLDKLITNESDLEEQQQQQQQQYQQSMNEVNSNKRKREAKRKAQSKLTKIKNIDTIDYDSNGNDGIAMDKKRCNMNKCNKKNGCFNHKTKLTSSWRNKRSDPINNNNNYNLNSQANENIASDYNQILNDLKAINAQLQEDANAGQANKTATANATAAPPPAEATTANSSTPVANATAEQPANKTEEAQKPASLNNEVKPNINGINNNKKTKRNIPYYMKRSLSDTTPAERKIQAKIDYLREKYKRESLLKSLENDAQGENNNAKNNAYFQYQPSLYDEIISQRIRKKRSSNKQEQFPMGKETFKKYINPMDNSQSPEHIKLLEESFPNPAASNSFQYDLPHIRVKRTY